MLDDQAFNICPAHLEPAMADLNSSESLQALYADLVALSEERLSSLDRLYAQIDAHVEAFKALLDKNARNEQSRKSLATGNRQPQL